MVDQLEGESIVVGKQSLQGMWCSDPLTYWLSVGVTSSSGLQRSRCSWGALRVAPLFVFNFLKLGQ